MEKYKIFPEIKLDRLYLEFLQLFYFFRVYVLLVGT